MNRPDKKNKTIKTAITALIFCGFFVMAGFLAIPEVFGASSDFTYYNDSDPDFIKIHTNTTERKEIQEFVDYDLDFRDVEKIEVKAKVTADGIYGLGFWFGLYNPTSGKNLAAGIPGNINTDFSQRPLSQDNIISSGDFYDEWAIFTVELDHSFGTSDEFKATVSAETIDGNHFISDTIETIYPEDSSFCSLELVAQGDEMMEEEVTAEVEYIFISGDKTDDPLPSEPEPFDGFDAITKPADPYSLNEYVLTSEVLDFGDYDFEASDNHLAQGVQVFDGDGQIIHEPAKNIIDNFETPADFSTVFEAEPGETYGYRWRYAYVDHITGQTIDSKLTPLENFSHEIDEEAPELETLNAQDVTDTGAELRGRVLSLGDYESLEVSFEWVEAGGENWNETDPVATLDDTFEYPATVWYILDNLEPATTYYFRIKADEYRGSAVSFTTGDEPIDDPEDPVPVDWDDWPSFYDLESDEEFDDPVGVIDGIGTTFDGIMGSIIERIEPFEERLETGQAYSHGREAGKFIPTMRGYLIEFRPFFGGLPVAEVFVFFLIFQIVILAIKGVMIALGFLPFF